jgi:hypothetical protein
MKYIITENKLEQVILRFLNKGYGDLTEYRTDEHPNSIFYIKDKKVYMEQNLKNGKLWVDYYTIWVDLEGWFSLEYDDIQSVITKWVEESYNMRGVTPRFIRTYQRTLVEESYNMRGVTPQIVWVSSAAGWESLTI